MKLKAITLKDFFSRHDFVRCNQAEAIINDRYGEFDDRWEYCLIDENENVHPYNYWITDMTEDDVKYYSVNYKLRFVYSGLLDLWIFVNNICCGMAYEDVLLEPKN